MELNVILIRQQIRIGIRNNCLQSE